MDTWLRAQTRRPDLHLFQDNMALSAQHTVVRHEHRGSGSMYAFMSKYPKQPSDLPPYIQTWPECFANMITGLLQGLPNDRKYSALFKLQADVVNL
jgi:hypothetical protein